ncbi:MAG TPA: type IV pilin [Methanoregula sp.]|nr:type IV pilin [Methanoregula sp.]
MSSSKSPETAASQSIGIILMLTVTIILAALVLLLMVQLPYQYEESVPAIFKITKIRHENDSGRMTYDSRMVVGNTGNTGYQNMNLYALTYRNEELLASTIKTVNGHDFISTHHYKIQNLGGAGSCGATWDPGELIYIDYTDRTFHPGDVVTFEVYDVVTDKIISRHTYTA